MAPPRAAQLTIDDVAASARRRLTQLEEKKKLDRIVHKWNSLANNVAHLDRMIRNAGMQRFQCAFNIVPTGQDLYEWNQLFEFGDDGGAPELLMDLQRLRDLMDASKTWISIGNVREARYVFKEADEVYWGMSDLVANATETVGMLVEKACEAHPNQPGSVDLPKTEAENPGKYRQVKAWVLCLPEVKKAMALGDMTEQQAYEMAIADDVDDELTEGLVSSDGETLGGDEDEVYGDWGSE